jgi:hypothetical protein
LRWHRPAQASLVDMVTWAGGKMEGASPSSIPLSTASRGTSGGVHPSIPLSIATRGRHRGPQIDPQAATMSDNRRKFLPQGSPLPSQRSPIVARRGAW